MFLTRISKLNCNLINGEEQTQEGLINSTKKEFRPTEIIQNPFNRKIGGCLKVIKNSDGKVIELKRVNKTPTMLYEKCLKKFLTFDNRGYNMVAIRYHNPISFHYKSPSLISSWKMVYGIGSSNRKRIYCKCPYTASAHRNGVIRPWIGTRTSVRTLYSAYRNPFYSGFFTSYDVCAKARIRSVGQQLLFPEYEKLKENGSIRLVVPGPYISRWLDAYYREEYYKKAYTSQYSKAQTEHNKIHLPKNNTSIPIEDFVKNDEPPFTYQTSHHGKANNYIYVWTDNQYNNPRYPSYSRLRNKDNLLNLKDNLLNDYFRLKFIFK